MNDQPLIWASRNGHLDIVKYLVGKGANIHADDDEALRLASHYGHLEVVKYLVEKGANIRARDDYALKYARRNGHVDVVKYLEECHNNSKMIFWTKRTSLIELLFQAIYFIYDYCNI